MPRHVLDLLKCDGSLPMSPGSGRTRCNFPGAEILEAVERLYILQLNVDRMLADSTLKGWMTSYNIEHGFSSPSHVGSLQQYSYVRFNVKGKIGKDINPLCRRCLKAMKLLNTCYVNVNP